MAIINIVEKKIDRKDNSKISRQMTLMADKDKNKPMVYSGEKLFTVTIQSTQERLIIFPK